MFSSTPALKDFTRFVVFLVVWQALVSSGYGQQSDILPGVSPTQSMVRKQPAPAASVAPLLTSQAGAVANPLAQTLATAALAAKPANHAAAPSKPARPKISPAAPITTIADPADGTDPYIIAQATALSNSPTQIFAFVRDQVGFDVYSGSLRGARGTLWTMAGNALDRASLLVALLRAAGFTAQYVQGTLTGAQATQILQQIFANPPLGVLGCIPAGTTLANPVSDPTLNSTLQQHFWVQFSSNGTTFQNADPTFAGAQLGQVFGTPTTTFTTVPASLETTVAIELDAEIYNSAETLFGAGDGLSTTPVLNATFATDQTAGRPLAIGHIVSSTNISSIFSDQTNTYTPYVSYGNTSDSTQDTVVTGTQYQEEFTSFPLGTTVVTGVFLTFLVTDSNGNTQTFNKTLFDRIGYAARQNGSSVSVSVTASGAPSISPLDITVVDILASLQNLSQAQSFGTALASIQPQLAALVAETASPSSPPTAQQISAMGMLATLSMQATATMGRVIAGAFAVRSDAMDNATVSEAYVKAFFNSPRLILVTNHITPGQGSQTITQELDTLKDDKASIPLPGNSASASISYNILRGTFDSIVESQVYQILTQNYAAQSGVSYVTGGSVADIFTAAQAQGIGTILLTPANAGELNNLPISADAQARISNALSANLLVFAPLAPVAINAANMYGWYEYDPTTGATTSVGEDGAHQGIEEYFVGLLLAQMENAAYFYTGLFLAGFEFGVLENTLWAISGQIFKNTNTQAGNSFAGTTSWLSNISSVVSILNASYLAFALGQAAAFAFSMVFLKVDPEVPGSLTTLPVPAAGSPGASPGVTAQLSTDTLLTLPLSGAELPLVYRVQIQNTGPSADTFNLTPASVPAGFAIETSLSSMTIPAGATAIVGVCAVPSLPIPAPGTPESFTINVTSATNPSVTTSAPENFTVPAVQGLAMSITPAQSAVTPGSSVNATLAVQATGNTAITASLSVTAPTPLSVNGVPTSISLSPGQTQSIPLTIGVPSGTAIGSQNLIQIAATVSAGVTPVQATAIVNVVAQQAQAAIAGANDAAVLGRTDIATTLSGLSGAINSAISSCTPAAQQLVVDYVDNLIQEMNAPFLANFVSTLQSDVAAISAATCSNIGAALTQLSTDLASLNTVLQSPAAFPFNLALNPNSAVAQPGQASIFPVVLQNNSGATNTYSLSLGSLPSGVTGVLSANSVTLGPGQSTNNPTVTITPPTSEAFQFSLSASINGVAGSTQTAVGTLIARSTFLAIESVTATPGFTNSGGSVDVTTQIANVVNQNKTVQVALVVNNSSNTQVLGPFNQTVALSVTNLLTTVDFGQIATMGLANGNYTLAVTVIDPVTNTVMPGGTGIGNLLIGSPVTATLTAMPTTLAPGNGTVTSTLNVSGPGAGGSGSIIPIGSVLTFGGTNAPDTYSAATTFGPTPVVVDSGAVQIWQNQVATGPNGEWDIFYMETTNGGPLANNINGDWNIVMDYVLSVPAIFDQVANQWLVNGTPVSPLTNGIGTICCAVTSNPILPGAAYYGSGFSGMLPAGTQQNWQQIYVDPYSLITNGGINPNTANQFIFALHFTRQTAVGAVQYTATVQVPTTGKVIYNPSSFSTTPTITPGAGFDTLTWTNPASNTITWTSNVTGISPADVLPVALGGTVNFTVTAGSGSITLPQVNINSGQIIGLNPGTQTVAPGQLASYTLIVNNPTSAAVTYNLAATGVNPSWVTLQPSVTVPANGSTNVPLTLRSTLADLAGTYNFMVTATSGGASGAVEGTMILVGTGSIGSLGSTNALGASVLLTPTQQTGGQGTPATFTVQVTNAGNVADTYTLSATTPGGVTATFSQPTLTIQPGLGNFQQTLLQLTAAPGTPPGPLNFTVTATSQTNSQIANTASGILNVISTGVAVSLSPPSVSPGGMFQLTVRNTGQNAGTFAIALGGPASVIATLASSSVTLAAGQSQNISVAIGSAPFAALGSLGLVATASANGVTGAAAGTVVIPSSQNVSAAFNPARTALSAPGPATLLLQVQNAGTTQDTYTATIVSTTGPVAQASIVDITGQNVQTTSPFILPGVTLGELAVNATLTANNASGTVTVKIVSQTNPSITALATGILGIGADMPVAIAGKNRNVLTGKYTSLDGGQSFDPGKATLTYAWTIVSKPAASVLTTLVNASTPQPDLLPDVNGAYTLQLIVNNGTQSSAPSLVTITAYTTGVPPNANAGAAANALRGSPVTLNGSLSNDPSGNNQALSYQWTIQSAPAGSTLTGVTLASTAMPSFTPDADGAFLVALTVTDSFGSSTDTVTITAYDPSVPPNAVAGANRRILIATPVTVNGSGSNDPGSSSALSYQWSFVSSTLPSSSLQNANTPSVTFTPPMAGFYVTRLDVSNGTANSFGEATVMAASYCDANADGVVNQLDFDLMTALSGTTAQANDPLDVNGDGLITAADVTLCQAKTGIVGGTVQLSLAPANLSFSYTIGGALPAAQGFGASSSSSSPLSTLLWSPNAPWIQLSPTSGQTPFNALASVNPTGLAPGGYQGLIYAAASGAGNVPQIVVTLEVYATPQFILTPASLNFSYQTGQAPPAPQTLEVASSGKVVPYTSSVSASWLSIQPSSGQTPYPSSVSVSPQNLAPGTYTGTITFTSPQAASASVAVTLVVTPAPPVISASNIVNAASLLSGPIAPGEMLNISGTGFAAPGAAILAPSGQALPMELGSTQVFFNNTPAPMSSVQANQVSVVVPYEVQGQSTVLLKVVYSGAASQTVNLIVTATAPGIFTSNSSGVGEITAVNVDGTLNSSGNPAARGTPITFYATGGGQTTPAGVDGALAGKTPPVPVAPVTLMIGGVEAQVTYAGGAPGYPAGLMQINAVIPPGIAPNVSTPVILTIGTAQSQPATTIATH